MEHFKILLFLLALVFLFGCVTPESNNNLYEENVITGKVGENGNFQKANKTSYLKTKILSEPGDKITFKVGEPFKVIIENFDSDEYHLRYSFDEDTRTGTIEISETQVVNLRKKCEIINIPPGPIPVIEVSGKLLKEQIVITPRYSPDCKYFLGWEIRAGATERGCSSSIINQLKKCRKNSIEELPKDTENYWIKILFGNKANNKGVNWEDELFGG